MALSNSRRPPVKARYLVAVPPALATPPRLAPALVFLILAIGAFSPHWSSTSKPLRDASYPAFHNGSGLRRAPPRFEAVPRFNAGERISSEIESPKASIMRARWQFPLRFVVEPRLSEIVAEALRNPRRYRRQSPT